MTLVLDLESTGVPRVLHWGEDLGKLTAADIAALRYAATRPVPPSSLRDPWWFTLVPVEGDGWQGTPALSGARGGAVLYPRLTLTDTEVNHQTSDDEVRLELQDRELGLAVHIQLRLETSGLVRIRHRLINHGPIVLALANMTVMLPIPAEAEELLDLTGRWCRERSPQRLPFTLGTRLRESRRGRTGHDAPLLLVAGRAGFGFRHGEVWATHVAWSGDHVHLAERLPERAGQASAVIGGGELLRPGEVRLQPGAAYSSPWVFFTWSNNGLDGAAGRIHRWIRSRPLHPRRPRPVVLNTWEAVYFDHDIDRLRQLADVAAALGVQRFVLDDGWFLGRRDDKAGLGDWHVDPRTWPGGLHPLTDHLRKLGMEIGLWVEPEMVNQDSDLARTHPDWVLARQDRPPRSWRSQDVLDCGRPEVAEYLFLRLDALIKEYRLDYLKWDHNRDLLEAVHWPTARAGLHAHTAGVYQLLDKLRARHPALEIETCSSGGARVDLEILERTDRVWASDTNDALERQQIQRWTGLLLPPELVGTHVGPPESHTTGRRLDLSLRCLTALFGHPGIEWDITTCTKDELRTLKAWINVYNELRPLLHTGDVVRADHPDSGALLHGVVAADQSEAVFAYVRHTTSPETLPGRVRLPGLDRSRRYALTHRKEFADAVGRQLRLPAWWSDGEIELPGSILLSAGIQLPLLNPGQGLLLHLRGVKT
ncbi:alpha-galactosidase [Kribbella sp. CA-294648]|uniref:alpha-galactosidase n=1 Tax=Kribbella sp. CA-294648 TaxID=3239948 RepID=UPI003D8B8F9F